MACGPVGAGNLVEGNFILDNGGDGVLALSPNNVIGQPIGTFQSIRAKLVDNATRIEAARLMTYRAASMKDAGRRTTLEAAMAQLQVVVRKAGAKP